MKITYYEDLTEHRGHEAKPHQPSWYEFMGGHCPVCKAEPQHNEKTAEVENTYKFVRQKSDLDKLI
jgi:hypothetical protein